MALSKQDLLAMLHDIEDKTCDGDHRAVARNYIVQLSIRNMTAKERAECTSFIERAMKAVEVQEKIAKQSADV